MILGLAMELRHRRSGNGKEVRANAEVNDAEGSLGGG